METKYSMVGKRFANPFDTKFARYGRFASKFYPWYCASVEVLTFVRFTLPSSQTSPVSRMCFSRKLGERILSSVYRKLLYRCFVNNYFEYLNGLSIKSSKCYNYIITIYMEGILTTQQFP